MEQKINIRLEPSGLEIAVKRGTAYRDILHAFGVEFPCGGNGRCRKCLVRLLKGGIRTSYTGILPENEYLACRSFANEDAVIQVPQWDSIILADESSFAFTPGQGMGIAVDAGSTTLVAQLLDLATGAVLDTRTSLNPQLKFGADIISRIAAAVTDERQAKAMTASLRQSIGVMVEDLAAKQEGSVTKVLLVGNAVMYHFFCGLEISPLAGYPFESPTNGCRSFSPAALGWQLDSSCTISFLPWIGGFVGSDIVGGIVATRMHEKSDYTILVDLGTNGEIALGNKDGICVASAAAGPAFEGSCIEKGMRATSGAIASVSLEQGHLRCSVIGNEAPLGICGSGLLDAVAVFLKTGEIDAFGNIRGNKPKIDLTEGIYLSQKDIREFQLAKAAIAAGIEILLLQMNLSIADVHTLYIAGAFGTYLNLEHLAQTGITDIDVERIVKSGNTALTGAKALLFTDREKLDAILQRCRHIGLESHAGFQDIFASKMFFTSPEKESTG